MILSIIFAFTAFSLFLGDALPFGLLFSGLAAWCFLTRRRPAPESPPARRKKLDFLRKPKTYKTPGGYIYSLYSDMMQQPHTLIAGATGSGKSVVISGIIHTVMHRPPFESKPNGAKLILIDPKRVELAQYRFLPHTILYASEPEEMRDALKYAMDLTEARYKIMQEAGARKYAGGDIYIIIDEWADLYLTDRKHTGPLIQRLAQIGRAAKVHVILATQTPIAKVLPTEIKCNFDARVGLRTRSASDSRNIIGKAGLETLPRYGKGYYMQPGSEKPYDIPMIPEAELEKLVAFWAAQR